jgi:hypothetical protein
MSRTSALPNDRVPMIASSKIDSCTLEFAPCRRKRRPGLLFGDWRPLEFARRDRCCTCRRVVDAAGSGVTRQLAACTPATSPRGDDDEALRRVPPGQCTAAGPADASASDDEVLATHPAPIDIT